MPLKDASNLYFYEEDRGSQLPSQSYLVGLFRSARHSEVSAYGSPNWLCRLLQPRVRPLVVCDDASFVAAAYVEEAKLKRTELPVLHIRNIAAKEGYGPTLYASIIQLARDSRLDGVVPNQNPADILSGPKEIWRRFACDYKDQITLIPTRETVHREGWLNNVFALTGNNLLDLASMRSRLGAYMSDVKGDPYAQGVLRDMAFQLARKSVDAHRSTRE